MEAHSCDPTQETLRQIDHEFKATPELASEILCQKTNEINNKKLQKLAHLLLTRKNRSHSSKTVLSPRLHMNFYYFSTTTN
jgi:hypothetical protein